MVFEMFELEIATNRKNLCLGEDEYCRLRGEICRNQCNPCIYSPVIVPPV